MKIILKLTVVLLIFCVSGCGMYSARFSPPFKQETSVVLKENDFHTVDRNLTGTYACWFLRIGYFPPMTLDIPLDDPRLFSNALADLYSKSNKMAEGKSTQMMNWTLDSHTLLIPIPCLWPTRRTVTFRADIMEFTK